MRSIWKWGIGIAAVIAVVAATRVASAAPSADELTKRARTLLASRGFVFVPSAVSVLVLDTIGLVALADGAVPASTWAQTQHGLGRRVLVPIQFVDGERYPYGGSGMPSNVIAVLPKNAPGLLGTGLYVEYVP
jgi:hypothetical protein